uniref:Uncharacterized protein n=1 Tax=Theropithecus gelada TaxID=9565 RepID=A0A8D2FEY8_THEGE
LIKYIVKCVSLHAWPILLDLYLGVELLSHMATLCLISEKLPNCFPKQLHHFTFPTEMYESSKFSTSLPTLLIMCHFSVLLESLSIWVLGFILFCFWRATLPP